VGAQGPTWNAGFIETHLTVIPIHPRHRYELIRMSRQALPIDAANGYLRGERSFRELWGYRCTGFWISLLPIYV